MIPEKSRTPTESRSAKRELERRQMTLRANNFSPDMAWHRLKKYSNAGLSLTSDEMRTLIDSLNRVADEIKKISQLLERSVEP